MTARLCCVPIVLLLAVTGCSKNAEAPAANERTATDGAAAKAVNDTDAALRDAAAPLPEPLLPRPQDATARHAPVEPR